MLRTLFVSALIAAGFTAAAVNRFAALVFYVWFALFRPMEWVWIDLSDFRLSLVAGLSLVLPCIITGVFPNITHPISLGMLAFAAAAGVAHFGAVSPQISFVWIDYFVRLMVTCLLVVTLVTTRRRFIVLLAVMAGSFGFHTAKAGLASLIHGGVRFFDGLAGAFADNNDYALGAAMTLWLLLGTAQNVKARWAKMGWFLAAPLTGFMIISTFSRGGFLALVAGTIVFVALQKRRLRAAAAAAMLFYASSVVFTPPKGWTDRISTIRTYEETGESSALSRPHFWRVAIDMAMTHPLGVGLFNYSSNYDRFDTTAGEYGRSRSVHSSHFQVLAETGVIGISAYGFLFGYAVIGLFRIRRRAASPQLVAEDAHFLHVTASALLASIAAFLVGGAFLSMALNDLTWLVFALVAALDRLSLRMVAAPENAVDSEMADKTSAAVPQPAQA